jgi:hypothetical protein
MSASSPKIVDFAWGRVDVENHGQFKDVKLFPSGARAWDWNETGTRHRPGIQPEDVTELVAHGARAIVLSQGVNGRLQVMPETIQTLRKTGIEVYVLPTEDAVARYNELAAKGPVGALIHSTC